MSRPHVYRAQAIVLRRADFAEADRLLTLYTPELGKVRALAKGVRRPGSKLAGHLELFCHSNLLLAVGRNLDIVTQAQTIDAFAGLRERLPLIAAAHYLCELVDAFDEERVENGPVFDLLRGALAMLPRAAAAEWVVRYVEVQALRLFGYATELRRCVLCRAPAERLAAFSAYRGGALCAACAEHEAPIAPVSAQALRVLASLQAGDVLMARRLHAPPPVAREVAATLRYHIRFVLERDLRSTQFLDTLEPYVAAPRAGLRQVAEARGVVRP